MEIIKSLNDMGVPSYEINIDGEVFRIWLEGNLDLYWMYKRMPGDIAMQKDFLISKDEGDFYYLVKDLINSIDNEWLIDGDVIRWYSDDKMLEDASLLEIEVSGDVLRVSFVRNPSDRYTIRMCNSGSRYGNSTSLFMDMYKKMNELDIKKNNIRVLKRW